MHVAIDDTYDPLLANAAARLQARRKQKHLVSTAQKVEGRLNSTPSKSHARFRDAKLPMGTSI
jgi:hypothetical protein